MRLIPNFKGFDFFPHDLRLPFMRYKDVAVGLSIVAMLISLALIMTRGLNYGVDFKGGSLVELQSTSGKPDLAALRSELSGIVTGTPQIQEIGGQNTVLIRTPRTRR